MVSSKCVGPDRGIPVGPNVSRRSQGSSNLGSGRRSTTSRSAKTWHRTSVTLLPIYCNSAVDGEGLTSHKG